MENSASWPEYNHSIISIGRYRAPRHREIKPAETQRGLEKVELLTGGEVYFEEKGRERLFGCGAIFWHQSGEYTIHKAVPYNPYECITIIFKTNEPSDSSIRTPRVSRWEDPPTVKKFAGDVLEHFHAGIMDKNVLSHYIYSRLHYHIFQYHNRMSEKSRPGPLRSVLEYVDDNLARDLSLDALSAYSQLSVSHLHALFKEHLNQTPHQFITNRRLQQARSLLAGSDLRMGEICYKCGFINSETFNRCFKKAQGMTPTQFRVSQRPVG